MVIVLEANVMPYALKLIVDAITQFEGDKGEIFSIISSPLTLYFGCWILLVIIFRGQHLLYVYIIPKLDANMRMSILDYVKQHSHSYFADNFAGSIANKIGDLPRAFINLFHLLRWQIITTLSVAIATLIISYNINPKFTGILSVWFIVHMGLAYYFARKIGTYSKLHADSISTLTGKIVDVLTNITNMRLFARGSYEKDYIGKHQESARKKFFKTEISIWKLTVAFEIPALVMFGSIIYLLITGWQQNIISAGDLVLMVFMSTGLLHQTWHLGMELAHIFKEVGICKQALSIIASPHDITDKPDSKPLVVKRGEIIFDNVHFNYTPEKDIFKGKTLTIDAGSKIGLVGFSGSGKSTFVNLILRFYDVESGKICIDKQNIADVTQNSLRENISMIPQDTTLFHRTLMENIRYGRLDATDEEVIEASKKAHCHDFIQEMPEQYNALVGERGVKLSGGQRQRIAVARAILKNAPILILDEATSALDSLTEKYIQASLQSLMQGRTTVVIAHRLSTLSEMDKILVFKDGEIIEHGTHDELLTKKEHYNKLWNMQVGGFLPDKKDYS